LVKRAAFGYKLASSLSQALQNKAGICQVLSRPHKSSIWQSKAGRVEGIAMDREERRLAGGAYNTQDAIVTQ
jgi:hypothetical protein